MSGDLQTYLTMKVTSSSETSNLEEGPYITHDDVSEAQRLQDLAGVGGYGGTLLDEESELHETLGELGIFATQQEEVK